ncbi:DMT family transporter [Citreicella sp. C3M06]|uniref:DMT family transporter n=1 Tax=Citreicella sp. C3M06 TaxID=2841564 RepID=UPI001C094704|nr:DMT family transporter [Citreicella sp. C3M06]MBU2963721.1 DMT family transporter [Citreicella sp. C3M06]
MVTLSDNTRGALLMMGSMAAFVMGDTCVKAIGTALPLGEVLLLRGLLATGLVTLLAWRLTALRFDLGRRDWLLVLARALAEIGSTWFYFVALRNMPLANVTALLQMLPLTLTLGSAVVFREPVGWRRWLAIGVGFCGMLLIVRPGTEGFTVYSVSALIAVVFVTIRDLLIRRMSRHVPSLMVVWVASVGVILFAGALSLSETWVPLDGRSGGLLALAAVLVSMGYSLSVMVMRHGEVSFTAPFRYTGLVWALVLGLLVFGDWPHPLTLIGAAIIVATGVFTLVREAQLRRRALRQAKMRLI